jgi:hypothetical protein
MFIPPEEVQVPVISDNEEISIDYISTNSNKEPRT